MPRGISNWTYKDVKKFLKYHNFSFFKEGEGSHEQWLSRDEKYIVDVNFITGSKSYPDRTLETMISNSGPELDKKHWKKWSNTGGHCCKK